MRLHVAICTLCLMGMVGCSPKGKALVKVGGTSITEENLQFLASINPGIAVQLSNPAGKKELLDNLVEQELLYKASLKNGVNRDKKIKQKIKLYQKVIIAQGYLEKRLGEEAKTHYEKNKGDFEQLQLAHIMVKYMTPTDLKNKQPQKGQPRRTEQEALALANQLRQRLDAGEDFAKVAKEASDDKSSNARGGDIGFVTRNDQRLKTRGFGPLVEKAFVMKVGEMGGPMKTDQGYHLIKLLQPAEQKSFEEVKDRMQQQLYGKVRQQVLAELKEKTKVTYLEEEKKPALKEAPTEEPAPADHPHQAPAGEHQH